MVSPSDLSSTPAGYMTPAQIEQMYGYSGALTQGATRDKEITSPWQGVRMMADALAMNKMRGGAGQQQMQGIQDYTHRLEQAPGQPLPAMAPPPAPPQMQPSLPAQPIRPPPPMSGTPVPGLQGSVPSGMPGGMPGAPVDPMQALMMPPPGQGMA